jgi:hypothetical protein
MPAFFHCGFITTEMGLTMMAPAQRHDELIADLSAERAMLREAQMVRLWAGARKSDTAVWPRT